MTFNRSGFVALLVLQAFVFVVGFSGLLIHQVNKLSDAHLYRLQSLSEKTILNFALPKILACMQADACDLSLPFKVKITGRSFFKELLVEPFSHDGLVAVFKITALREYAQHGCWAYLFVEQHDKETNYLVYKGMQFGAAL